MKKPRLPTQTRPKFVSRWMQLARDFTCHPAEEKDWSLASFADEWEMWWISCFDNKRGTSIPLEREGATSDWWKLVNRGNQNGYFLLLLCLAWWADSLEADDHSLRSRLAHAVDDVVWVCDHLVAFNEANVGTVKRPAESELNVLPAKRVRRK